MFSLPHNRLNHGLYSITSFLDLVAKHFSKTIFKFESGMLGMLLVIAPR